MTKRLINPACLFLIILFLTGIGTNKIRAQVPDVTVKGVVTESGTGLPLHMVSISVTSTGSSTQTDEQGAFTIQVPDLQAGIIIDLPDYIKRTIFLNGRDFLNISLVSAEYKSFDNFFNTPLGPHAVKDATYAVTGMSSPDLALTKVTSFDQVFQGRVPGMNVIEQSGMPGHRTFMNIRGFSSLYAQSQPLLFIDGMIHDYSYADRSLMEGFALNPFDVVDIEDITDITIQNDGLAYLGSAGSNGLVNVTTEQKSETSTVIKFVAYGGISMMPKKMDVLNAGQFRNYFSEVLESQNYSTTEIDAMYPWLNGNSSVQDYYKYNNNTDWQDEVFKPAALQKYHFFLKGGDDIATYNISAGFLNHKGIYENSSYQRFNLRINGKINITNKFSVTPNAKLSLADSYLPNQGFSEFKNPLLASIQMPSIMAPNARDGATGIVLPYLDDTGNTFDVSNPTAIVQNANGTDRNYHFLSSINAQYKFNDHFTLASLVGIDFNNARESIFLPDIGLVSVDSASNSPGDFVNEYRSTQNHTTLTYSNNSSSGHAWVMNGGFRYVDNNYKYNKGIDLNTPSDDFKSLGQGSRFNFLRSTTGDNRGLRWVSYFGNINYSFRNKYFLNTNLSYDASSVLNDNNRYNVFPSVSGAWRLSSESFLNKASWLEDLKLRGSWTLTGNMFSTVYDYSKLYYITRRMNNIGVLTRESIPNENLELEKKSTINAGLDLSVFKQTFNVHVDYFQSTVGNMIIQQDLPSTFGYTTYFDNGGVINTNGVEVSADGRIQAGDLVLVLGGSVSKQMTEVTELNFLDASTNEIITSIEGAEFVTSVGGPLNAFYGYQTNGIFSDAAQASALTGPKGRPMEAGDIRFVDQNGDDEINELDKVVIGDPNPDLFGGVFADLTFKNFGISALFNYSLGNEAFNFVKYISQSMDSYSNQSVEVLDRWTPSNTNAELPRVSYGDPTGNTVFSDRWIEDASYFRLKRLTVDYVFPPVSGVYKGITLYATATNLLTFTKYSGYDPDFQYLNNPFYMGVDFGKMPQTRSFVIGVKLDL